MAGTLLIGQRLKMGLNASFETQHLRSGSKKALLIIVWSLSALYVFGFYDRGWVPHDEGAIAQSAERILAGEMPHRDFDEIYTGGLTYLHAAAFKTLGLNLVSLRIVLLVFFLAFVPVFYALAVRLASPIVAAAVTLVAVVWTVPNYFASLPSWYNLFFATFGTLALSWHIETQEKRWLFAAGLFGGFSVLAKITGLYYVVAAVLFLTFREQVLNNRATEVQCDSSRLFRSIKTIGVSLFLAGLMMLLWRRPNLMEICYFLIPPAAICGVLLWDERQGGHCSNFIRLKSLCALLSPFIIGAAIPIFAFVVLYLSSESVADLYRGVFVLPQSRFDFASFDFPHPLTAMAAVPYTAVLFFPPSRHPTTWDKLFGFGLISSLFAVLYFPSALAYFAVWQSVRFLGVVAVLAASQTLLQPISHTHLDAAQRQILFLLASMTSLISLVQFPFTAAIYFCYTAPFVCLTLLAVLARQPRAPKFLHLGIMLFYFLFAITWTNTGYVAAGVRNSYPAKEMLDLPRGRLRVTSYDNHIYTQLVNLIRQHSNSNYIYATPDCPEIYFLSGKRNPTRNLFDFLGDKKDAHLLRALLREKNIHVVVINHEPQFSRILDQQTVGLLQEDFPHFVDVGHFTLRWKE